MMIIVALLCLFGLIASSPSSPQVTLPSNTAPRVAHTHEERAPVVFDAIELCTPSAPLTRDLTRPLHGDANETAIALCPDE